MHVPGLQSFSDPLQDSVSHVILINYVRKINTMKSPISNAMKRVILDAEIQLFHNQMKYPWGKIVMLEKNAENSNQQNQYYAIKDLYTVIKIIQKENFVRLLVKTDPEFKNLLNKSITLVNELLKKLQSKEILGFTGLTASTFALFEANNNNNFNVKLQVINCVKTIKIAWQNTWTKFKLAKNAFEFVLHDLNTEFEIKLKNSQPSTNYDDMFILAIDNNEDIRIWIRLNGKLFKAKPSSGGPLKWVETDEFIIEKTTSWWLSATKVKHIEYREQKEMYTELLDDFSSTNLYY
jgi:hypothetical protein